MSAARPDLLVVREAALEDVAAVAAINVAAWRAAYRGLLPDDFLAALEPARQAELWRGYVEHLPEADRLRLAEEDGRVVGYARTGLDAEDGRDGQLYGLYVEPERVGSGVGRLLLEHALDDLRARELRDATAWVFDGNERADRFFRAAGFERDGAAREQELDGVMAPELRYRLPLRASAA